jgi:hypothetical protein
MKTIGYLHIGNVRCFCVVPIETAQKCLKTIFIIIHLYAIALEKGFGRASYDRLKLSWFRNPSVQQT